MKTESIELVAVIPAAPEQVYQAWLDGAAHAAMTGGAARGSAAVGEVFVAWGGYITSRTVVLEPGRRIVQSWRTLDFPGDAADSQIDIELVPVAEGTELRLRHTDIPEGQASRYHGGWKERYFEPMARYFKNLLVGSST